MAGVPPYYDWIAHHAHRRPRQLAINDLQTNRKFTYADLHRRADQLAGWLTARGSGPERRFELTRKGRGRSAGKGAGTCAKTRPQIEAQAAILFI